MTVGQGPSLLADAPQPEGAQLWVDQTLGGEVAPSTVCLAAR